MERKNIAIVAGGDSSEFAVSLKSAEGILSFLDQERYRVFVVLLSQKEWKVKTGENRFEPIDKNDFSFLLDGEKITFDFAYITIHGTPGENGLLQGYFELIGMPYSSCGVLASALTFDKYTCNHYLQGFGLRIAQSILLRTGETADYDAIIDTVGLPCFVKPNAGGSSVATTKVKSAEALPQAIQEARNEGGDVIIESFMPGREVTCGCYKTRKGSTVLPLTEAVSKNEFFDYEAKYTASRVEEITPAPIPEHIAEQIRQSTSRIYDILGCKGIIRADYIIVGETPFLLEVNTTPGMTATSFIPQQVRAAGLDIKEVLTEIIEDEF